MTNEEQALLIDKIKELQKIESKAIEEKWESVNKLTKAIDDTFRGEWSKLEFASDCTPKFSLYMNNSNNWNAVITFCGIGWGVKIKNKMWVKEKEMNDTWYVISLTKEEQLKLELPEFSRVESFIKKYNEEHLIKIQVIESNYLMQPQNRPDSILNCADVEKCEVDPIEWIDTGIIPQSCSDMDDRYYVFRRSNGKVAIYYSVNGCGFGCAKCTCMSSLIRS
jgi:hypothetical protein